MGLIPNEPYIDTFVKNVHLYIMHNDAIISEELSEALLEHLQF